MPLWSSLQYGRFQVTCATCMFLSSCSLKLLIIHAAMRRFDGFAEETVTVQRLPGWFKQRSNRLYPVRALMR